MAEIIYDEAPGLTEHVLRDRHRAGAVGKAAAIDAAGRQRRRRDRRRHLLPQRAVLPGRRRRAGGRRARRRPASPTSPRPATARGRATRAPTSTPAAAATTSTPAPASTRAAASSGTVPTGRLHPGRAALGRAVGRCADRPRPADHQPGGSRCSPRAPRDNIATGDPERDRDVQQRRRARSAVRRDPPLRRRRNAVPEVDRAGQLQRQPDPEFDTNSNTINPDAASAHGLDGGRRRQRRLTPGSTPRSRSARAGRTRASSTPTGNPPRRRPRCASTPTSPPPTASPPRSPASRPFCGTSAAAPSAAGIATLLRSANPHATGERDLRADERRRRTRSTCTQSASSRTRTAARASSSPTSRPRRSTAPARSSTRRARARRSRPVSNGWYTGKVTVAFSVADPGVADREPSVPRHVPVTADGTQTFTCNALSGGGPGTGSRDDQARHEEAEEAEDQGDRRSGGEPPPKQEDQVQVEGRDLGHRHRARSRATARSPASTRSRRRPPTRPG